MPTSGLSAVASIDTSPIGSVGTLMGATLETAGHYLQSILLDLLNQGLASDIGTLLMLIAGVIAIFTVAVGGQYKYALWIFIGPALFFWTIEVRVPSTGANWKFGERSYSQKEVLRVTEDLYESQAAPSPFFVGPMPLLPVTQKKDPQVSMFFKWWDDLSSMIVQYAVGVLQTSESNFERTFVSKFEIYDAYLQQDITNPQLRQFLTLTLVKECSRYFLLLREKYNPAIDAPRKMVIEDELLKMTEAGSRVFSFETHPELRSWLLQQTSFPASLDKLNQRVGEAGGEPLPADLSGTYTCQQLWEIATVVTTDHAKDLISVLAEQSARATGQSKVEILDELTRRYQFGIDHLDDNNGEVDANDDTYREVLNDDQKMLLLINEMTGRLILRQLSSIGPAFTGTPSELAPDSWQMTEMGRSLNEETAREIQLLSYPEAIKTKGDFLTAMMAMPYVQGLGLYVLSFAFPFFMMSLLSPGRHHGIFVWMGLWMWIKSWDFAFAIVMLIDDLLYILMPSAAPIAGNGLQHPAVDRIGVNLSQPGTVFKALLEVDPTYSVMTHNNIIAACMAGVPVFTAVLFKKGGVAFTDLINQTLREFSGRLGESMASFQRSIRAQSNAGTVQKNIDQAVTRAHWKALSDPDIYAAFGKQFLSSAAKSRKGESRGGANNDYTKGSNLGIKFSEDLLGAAKSQQQKIALAKYTYNLSSAAYMESTSAYSRELSTDAVMLRYYHHDFSQAYPGSSQLNALKARYHLNYAPAVDGLLSGGTKLSIGEGSQSFFTGQKKSRR